MYCTFRTSTSLIAGIKRNLTQLLADGENAYLYGAGHIGEEQMEEWVYHLPDALGSVRQLVGTESGLTAQSYEPFGSLLFTRGSAHSNYGFTGEWGDGSGLVYLRARYYSPYQGRFLGRDPWDGDPRIPIPYNRWLYALANPILLLDPSGLLPADLCDRLPPDDSYWCRIATQCREEPAWIPAGILNISAYYITHESQNYSGSNSTSGEIPSLGGITANKYFLFSREGVRMQGTGRLKDGRYISCTEIRPQWDHQELRRDIYGNEWPYDMPPEGRAHREDTIPFRFTPRPQPPQFEAFETVAVCSSGANALPYDRSGKKYEMRIKDNEFAQVIRKYAPGSDNIFKMTDTGGSLCSNPSTVDIFIGEEPVCSEDRRNLVKRDIYPEIRDFSNLEVEYRRLWE